MAELNEARALNVVASGLGWAVGCTAGGFDVRIDRESGESYYGTTVENPATDDKREAAKDLLLESTKSDVELERIEQAFAAPWLQA